jgi:GT2 family glycosyltransferase
MAKARRTERPAGVSVVVCCHNSASRLPTTLHHLAAQEVPRDLGWEVIVVDNASTDRPFVLCRSHAWEAATPDSAVYAKRTTRL